MPDKRKHRGRHPDDDRLFAEPRHDILRAAVADYSWLLTRRYAVDSALKLVGDRHNLTARQRMAVRRCACTDEALGRRARTRVSIEQVAGRSLAIDGYNLLITIESALSGGLVLIGRDGCYRDLASIHGTYRKVEETTPALEIVIDHLAGRSIPRIDWYLDRPVANSGRLKKLIAELIAGRDSTASLHTIWNVELVNDPDAMLRSFPGPVVSSDSAVVDDCAAWVNLAAQIIAARVPDAWIVDLRTDAAEGF